MRLLGIDEAGRGCCAGPLCVAGVILHKKIDGLNDSKKLTSKKREELFEKIKKHSTYHIVFKSANEIDKSGLSTAIKKSIEEILQNLNGFYDEALFDGKTNFGINILQTMVKADLKVAEVSAASILAKVSRDRYMIELSKKLPQYQFHKHKGYVTKLHKNLIREYGYSKEHRKSYKLKGIFDNQKSLFD